MIKAYFSFNAFIRLMFMVKAGFYHIEAVK